MAAAFDRVTYEDVTNSTTARLQFDGWLGGVTSRSTGDNRKRLLRGIASRVQRERAFKKAARAYAEYVAAAQAKGDGKILDFFKWLVEFAVKNLLPIILPLFT